MTAVSVKDAGNNTVSVAVFVPGTAGTPSPDVQTIQGASGMTPITIGSIPAGSNNIGSFNLASSIPVGTNTIGGVNIASALPTGTNVIGNVGINGAIPTGSNTIGNVTLNSGVSVVGSTSGGLSQFHALSLAATTAVAVKASAGQIYGWEMINTTSSYRYVKLYDIAQGSVTVGTSAVKKTIGIPPNGQSLFAIPAGLTYATAITYAVTAGATDADTTAGAANDVIINFDYQ